MTHVRRQRKLYVCPACKAEYLHDLAYHHALFQCSKRKVQKATASPHKGRSA